MLEKQGQGLYDWREGVRGKMGGDEGREVMGAGLWGPVCPGEDVRSPGIGQSRE